MQIELEDDEVKLLIDLLDHRVLKFRTDAAYTAYSFAYNRSVARRTERKRQVKAAEESDRILNRLRFAYANRNAPKRSKL